MFLNLSMVASASLFLVKLSEALTLGQNHMILQLLLPFSVGRPPTQGISSLQDPSVTTWRSQRDHEVRPEEGEPYKDSALRRFVHGRKVEMFPDNLMGRTLERAKEHPKAN